jgi:L-rhamnose-proton symport protein (RhaT)
VETSIGLGIFAVLLGGVFQGSVFLPMKFTRRWKWENTWACFSAVAYLLTPWLLACSLVSRFPQMLGEVSPHVLVTTLLFGAGMGFGALMMGVAYRYVGMAITFAIVLGIASSIGTLVPLLVLAPDQVMKRQGLLVMAGVAIALVGTGVVSWAAWERDAKKEAEGHAEDAPAEQASARSLMIGLALCIGSGVLSSCGNLGFAFGSQISQRAQEMGAGHTGSASAVWTMILLPVFLCNFTYSLFLLRKNKSYRLFRKPGTAHYWGWGILMGVDWMAGMAAYGAGALAMGKLGTSMGWILFMASMIAVANILGALTGEWKGASRRTLGIMGVGVLILLFSIVVVGMAGAGG